MENTKYAESYARLLTMMIEFETTITSSFLNCCLHLRGKTRSNASAYQSPFNWNIKDAR